MQPEALVELWSGLDRCDGCKDPRFADPHAPAPGRPNRAPGKDTILFVGEAPPKTGGFWRERNGDAVRRLLLPALPSWPGDLDPDSKEAIDWFVDRGYFFVQAMKWTLMRQSYLKLGAEQRRTALRHAVQDHLVREVELIEPAAIIALGTAAWRAAGLIAAGSGQQLDGGRIASARLRHHALRRPGGDIIPVHATFLPGRINDRFGNMDGMRQDVRVFLRCIAGEQECESASPRLDARRRAAGDSGRRETEAEFREWMRRLKAAGLWPRPQGMTFEAAMEELRRRERQGSA